MQEAKGFIPFWAEHSRALITCMHYQEAITERPETFH